MKIVGLDIGYGDVKVVISDLDGEITHQFKFNSAIATARTAGAIKDARIYDLDIKGSTHSVYVGEDAMALPSSDIQDITHYATLEKYAPVFIAKALDIANLDFQDVAVLVVGLSVTQLGQSGYFKERVQNFKVNDKEYNFETVFLLPQGAGSKMAFDKYGVNFPEPRALNTQNTYVGCDIGFNTLDLFYVTCGKTSPNLFEGLAEEGVMRIARIVQEHIDHQYQRNITLREAKDILVTKTYKLRGQKYDMREVIKTATEQYKKRLLEIINTKYGDIIDKCDFICLQGGGAHLFEDDQFFKVVKQNAEYYNAVGFCLFGVLKYNNKQEAQSQSQKE